jgi:CBS domain-containing protein
MPTLKTPVQLREILSQRPAVVLPPDTTIDQACKSMRQARKGAVLVSDGKRLCGIFTERDLVNRVIAEGKNPQQTPLGQVMTTNLVVIHPNDSHEAALSVMVSHSIRHLPVVEGDHVLGVVSRRQLMAVDNAQMEAAWAQREASRLFL